MQRFCELKFDLDPEEKGCDSNVCCFYCESVKTCGVRCDSLTLEEIETEENVTCESDVNYNRE